MITAAARVLTDHRVNNTRGNRAIVSVNYKAHLFPCLLCFTRQLETDLVVDRKRPHGHSDCFTEVVDTDRFHALHEHPHTLIKVSAKCA